jgi:hypothetical protein
MIILSSALSMHLNISSGNQAEIPLAVFLPNVGILVLLIAYYIRYRNSYERLICAANRLYFIGYLCTISSLIYLVVYIGLQPDFNLPASLILKSFGIALSTTFVGLVGMLVLKRAAAEFSDTGRGGGDGGYLLNGGQKRKVDSTVRSILNFGNVTSEAIKNISVLNNKISELNRSFKTLGNLTGSLSSVSSAIEGFSGAIQSFELKKETKKELSEGLDWLAKFISTTKNMNRQFKELQGTFATTTQQHMALNSAAESHNKLLKNLNSSVGGAVTRFKGFQDAINELELVLRKFAELEARNIARMR